VLRRWKIRPVFSRIDVQWITRYTHIIGLGPLVLGQQLVGDAALEGAAESVDAVVGLLGGEAL
jgi:hypothetical protein